MAKIKKRGRGRPDRMGKLLHDLQINIIKGQEDLVEAYPEAISLLITIMKDQKASPTNRLSAAKTIKEYVEASLEAYEEEESEESSKDQEDSQNTGILLKIE